MDERKIYITDVEFDIGDVLITSYDPVHDWGKLHYNPTTMDAPLLGCFNYALPIDGMTAEYAVDSLLKINPSTAIIEILDYKIYTPSAKPAYAFCDKYGYSLFIKFRFINPERSQFNQVMLEQLEREYQLAPEHFKFILRNFRLQSGKKRFHHVVTVDMQRVIPSGQTKTEKVEW